MNTAPDSPEADPHAACTGNCEAAADDSKKSFGVRGAVIAGSLGLAVGACMSAPKRDLDRMTTLYGPAPMMKDGSAAKATGNGAVREAPKPKKAE